jgi:signal transduction histidine kinase
MSDPRSHSGGTADLTSALRGAAARAAEAAGASAMVFACAPQETPGARRPALRAAAGFASTDAARAAANALEKLVRDVHETGAAVQRPASGSLAAEAPAGVVGLPLVVEDRHWGALVVLAKREPSAAARQTLDALAEATALRLDHAHLAAKARSLQESLQSKQQDDSARADEILKLSEALFAQDIELLRNSEKLGKVEKLKNDFIEKMSRELRTPLDSIIEAIISVLAGENDALSESAKANLRAALDDGTAFLRTLRNILDLWRIKQNELPVELQDVSFREVVDEAIFSVQDTLGDKDIAIEKALVEPLPKLRTDLTKVNQILFLLLDNAVKFTERGRIEIAAEVVSGRLHCRLTDTGIGICNDDRQFIFDEFFQVDDSRSSRYRGAGLGLTLVRELLGLLDGEIAVESEVGVGTTVSFSLPVQITPSA